MPIQPASPNPPPQGKQGQLLRALIGPCSSLKGRHLQACRHKKSQAEQDKEKKNLLKVAGAVVAVAAAVTLGVKAYKSNQVCTGPDLLALLLHGSLKERVRCWTLCINEAYGHVEGRS